jgi:hypothetical protein
LNDCEHPFSYAFFLETGAADFTTHRREGKFPRRIKRSLCSGCRDIHKNLWISLWIVAE